MQTPILRIPVNLLGPYVDHEHSGQSGANKEIEANLRADLTKVFVETDDVYRSSVNKCQVDHEAKVTYCFKPTVRSMNISRFIEEVLSA